MRFTSSPRVRRWLFVPPVLLGIAFIVWQMLHTRQPERIASGELARVLRVIDAPQVDVVPRVLGYGTAAPAQVWRAVAEVEGRVIEVHPELNPGAFLKEGDVVLKIDPREFELTASQLEAEIAEVQAQLAELDTQEENDRASMVIEEAALKLTQTDLDRVRGAAERDAASPTEVRDKERTFLAQKQKVQALQNALNLVPRQRTTLGASLAVKKARLEQARLDIQKTIVQTPFDCRLGEVHIEQGQFLKAGEALFDADGVAVTEVDAQVSIDRARALLHDSPSRELGGVPDMERLREIFDVAVTVRLHVGDWTAEWDARFARIREQIDPVTRTIGLVVAVDRPYEQAIPGQRPPLLKGMFCEVELRGDPLSGRIVVPRAALHDGHVYIVDPENRLRRRAVSVLFSQSDFICLEGGLEPGDKVVVSDPMPAIEGMLVKPVADDELRSNLIAQATARTGVR